MLESGVGERGPQLPWRTCLPWWPSAEGPCTTKTQVLNFLGGLACLDGPQVHKRIALALVLRSPAFLGGLACPGGPRQVHNTNQQYEAPNDGVAPCVGF